MRLPLLFLALLCVLTPGYAQKPITFPLLHSDVQIHADLYGSGTRCGVILAHGGRFHKESWKMQAEALANAGCLALALQFRGDHFNPDRSPGSSGETKDNADDVLAAVAYLQRQGVKELSAVGGSMGGDAVGEADAQSKPGDFARIVVLGSDGGASAAKLNGRKLFLVARDDSNGWGKRLPGIEANFAKAPQPKRLVVVEGSAHAQFLFATPQGPDVWSTIQKFLLAP